MLLSERNLQLDPLHRASPLPLEVGRRARSFRSVAQTGFETSDQVFRLGSDRPQTRPTRVLSGQPDEPCLDPLYLFACALEWHKQANAGAGWELISGLRVVRRNRAGRRGAAGENQTWKPARYEFKLCEGCSEQASPAKPTVNTRHEQGGGKHEHSVRIRNHRELCHVQIEERQVVLRSVPRACFGPSAIPAT